MARITLLSPRNHVATLERRKTDEYSLNNARWVEIHSGNRGEGTYLVVTMGREARNRRSRRKKEEGGGRRKRKKRKKERKEGKERRKEWRTMRKCKMGRRGLKCSCSLAPCRSRNRLYVDGYGERPETRLYTCSLAGDLFAVPRREPMTHDVQSWL